MKPPFWRRDRTKKTRQVCPDPIIGTQNSKYTFLYFPKTDGVQVVRVHRPGKKLPKLKLCFLMKVMCIYIKNLKESRHEAFI